MKTNFLKNIGTPRKNYINHIAFVIDRSGSIRGAGLEKTMVDVFNAQIKKLAVRARELDQDTRVSVYLFNEDIECLCFDADVNRIPDLRRYYKASGDTAMIDATLRAIDDLKDIPQRHGDHSFLIYVLTDGENRINNCLADQLHGTIETLPENYTVAALVPDQDGVYECKKFGFPANNIQVWQTTRRGMEEMGQVMSYATDTYMLGRSKGIRGTKNLFALDASKLSSRAVKQNLVELKSKQYELLPVRKVDYIKPFVINWLGDYRVGSAYYQITKNETIQANKQLAVQDKVNGRIYIGTEARDLLGLPNYEVKVSPSMLGKYDVFCQSTSTNRKLMPGTKLLVLK